MISRAQLAGGWHSRHGHEDLWDPKAFIVVCFFPLTWCLLSGTCLSPLCFALTLSRPLFASSPPLAVPFALFAIPSSHPLPPLQSFSPPSILPVAPQRTAATERRGGGEKERGKERKETGECEKGNKRITINRKRGKPDAKQR